MIDLETVQAKAWEVCTRWPDRVNPWDEDEAHCLYTADDGTHCAVGQILAELGVEPLPDWEGNGVAVLPDIEHEIELVAVCWLQVLQSNADERYGAVDGGWRWADALADAIRRFAP